MPLKLPPPPPIATQDPTFNRWLLELTSILSNDGGIDPGEVTGLPDVITQVGTNTTDVAALGVTVAAQGDAITALQNDVAAIEDEIATINGQITSLNAAVMALQARSQVYNGSGAPAAGLGVDGDWYASTGTTKHVYVRVSGAWTQIV